MARSLEQIAKDLTTLEATTDRIDQELQALYQDYLTALGPAVKHQLVLAAYQLCTQTYPEDFLQLSVSQRENVQAGIRKIAEQGRQQIEQLGQAVARQPEPISETSHPEADPEAHEVDPEAHEIVENEIVEAGTSETIAPDADTADSPSPPVESSDNAQSWQRALSLFDVFRQGQVTPVLLAKRHVLLERHLRAILQTLSNLTNYLLKQMEILPDFPDIVIAAASEAASGETANLPNLLNVLIEIESSSSRPDENSDDDPSIESDDDFEDEPEREMTYLVALNLRLADIEFADTQTAVWRSKIQETLVKLKRLGSQYQKLQQEKARAEAEHAWRAIWFEE